MEAPPKTYCKAANMPLGELADRAGISRTLLYDYCAGRCRMSDKNYMALCVASGGEIKLLDLVTWFAPQKEEDPRPTA